MTALSERQAARVECLRVAREVLAPRNVMGAGSLDAIDVVNVAMYIETGDDPWQFARPAGEDQ